MKEIIDSIALMFGGIFLISVFGMGNYLKQNKIYTWWQLRFHLMWPRIIFEYRDHTKKYSGKIGFLYHLCKVSFFIFIGIMIALNVPQLFLLSTPIAIVIVIVTMTIIPAIGYIIYGLSKEKYF